MEPEQKFVVVTVIVLLMLSLLSLGGCDYWPPALQAEIAGLRAHLNDVLDENAKLYEELAALKAATARPPGERELRSELAGLPRSRPSADAEADSDDVPPLHRTNPSPALVPAGKVVKRPSFYLTLTQPAQRGAEVAKLQRLLRRHEMPVHVDGVYGAETTRAIRTFQRIRHLTPDGIAGPVTYAALRQRPSDVRLVRQVRAQRPSAAGGDVIAVQTALRRAGYRVTADGRYGPETVAAIGRFQRDHGLPADGVMGPDTWRALRRGHATRDTGARPTRLR